MARNLQRPSPSRKAFRAEQKGLIMKSMAQKINGLSGNLQSKCITEENFHPTVTAEVSRDKKHLLPSAWYPITNPGQSSVLSQHSFLLLHLAQAIGVFNSERVFLGQLKPNRELVERWQKRQCSELLNTVSAPSQPCLINNRSAHLTLL